MATPQWLSFSAVMIILVKVNIALLSMYGTGSLITNSRKIRRLFPSMPSLVWGMAFHIAMTALLSLPGLLTRTLLPYLMFPGAIYGMLLLVRRTGELRSKHVSFSLFDILFILIALYVVSINILDAARPELMEQDSLITYAVQPDRWLDNGRVYFLDETVFSAMPLAGEMLAVWPASMASDKLDQISVLQVWGALLFLLSVILSARILGVRTRMILPVIFAAASCNLIADYTGFAKTDMTALFFLSIALASQARRVIDSIDTVDYAPYLAFGLALAVKFTAAPALAAFAVLVLCNSPDRQIGRILKGVGTMSLFPFLFALRTIYYTGSPFYPEGAVELLLKDEWKMPELHPLISMRLDRTSELHPGIGFFKGLLHMLRRWELPFLTFLAGIVAFFASRKRRMALILLGSVLAYIAIAAIAFHPAWWGYKYTVLFLPFLAVLGGRLLQGFLRTTNVVYLGTAMLFLFLFSNPGYDFRSSSLPEGPYILSSFASGEWKVESYPMDYIPPNTPLQLWMNQKLPEDARILSLWEPTRYFAEQNHICAWRHPSTMGIFGENTVHDEIEMLIEVDIDYVTFVRSDPMPMHIEKDLAILSHIGTGEVLEPMISINGFLLCRFDPDNLEQDALDSYPAPPEKGYDVFVTGSGSEPVTILNNITGLAIHSIEVNTDAPEVKEILQGHVVFPLETVELWTYPGLFSFMIADQSGIKYWVPALFVGEDANTMILDDSIDPLNTRTLEVGEGSTELTVQNNLPFASVDFLRIWTEDESSFLEILHGNTLSPRDRLTVRLDDPIKYIEAVDSDGCQYTLLVNSILETELVWFISFEDISVKFDL